VAVNKGFILFTYKIYGHLDRIGGQRKSNCLNVLLSLLKYAWKKNGYKCAVRYSTLSKDTGLAKITIRRCVHLLAKLNVIKIKRLASANEYIINSIFMTTEGTNKITQGTIIDHSEGINKITINKRNNIKEIDNIISKGYDKEKLVEHLSRLPLALLKADKTNIYYCKLAIALKEENDKPKVELNTGVVLKDLKKKTNQFYRSKVEYNKRNNIKPWED